MYKVEDLNHPKTRALCEYELLKRGWFEHGDFATAKSFGRATSLRDPLLMDSDSVGQHAEPAGIL